MNSFLPAVAFTLVLFSTAADKTLAQNVEPATTDRAAAADDPALLTRAARAKIEAGDAMAARELLNRAILASPNDPGANQVLGELLLSEQRYPEAMDRFETILSTNLRDPGARKGELAAATQLALAARNSGRGDAALAALGHAREHLPDDPTLLREFGIQAEQVHQLPAAQEALEAALKIEPGDARTLYALSRVELDREHFGDSERHLRAYLAVHPDDATAHFGMGHLLQMQQRIDEAKTEFERSIELQPVQTESYYQLGQIALDAGQPDVAQRLFERTLARAPEHGGALTGLGILAYRRKDFAAARERLEAAVRSSPEYQPAHYYLGLTLGRLGLKAESERELKLAVELAHAQDPRAAGTATQPPGETPH